MVSPSKEAKSTAELLDLVDFFSSSSTTNTIKNWTLSQSIQHLLSRLSNYQLPSYQMPISSTLPERLLHWGKLSRAHYLDFAGFEKQVSRLLCSDSDDSLIFNEILRIATYRSECCKQLCDVWEQLGTLVSEAISKQSQSKDLKEFFKSTSMDSGLKILRLGLAELASQISRGAVPGLIISSTGLIALAENSSLSTILPAAAVGAAVPIALITVGSCIIVSSVVFALYQYYEARSASAVSALNLDFSPFLWELETWKHVRSIILDQSKRSKRTQIRSEGYLNTARYSPVLMKPSLALLHKICRLHFRWGKAPKDRQIG